MYPGILSLPGHPGDPAPRQGEVGSRPHREPLAVVDNSSLSRGRLHGPPVGPGATGSESLADLPFRPTADQNTNHAVGILGNFGRREKRAYGDINLPRVPTA